MSEQKLNEDGLIPGQLVDHKLHAKIMNKKRLEKRQELAKASAKKAAK